MDPTPSMGGRSTTGSAVPAFIAMRGVSKTYGAVRALTDVDFTVGRGEVIGLVGHNGAGKSTLMNVLSGTVARTAGAFELDGAAVGAWSGKRSQGAGLRCVCQELSLCANLSAAENTRVVHRPLRGWGWRRRAGALISAKLDEIFPGHGIDPQARVSGLSIGERQMVEIARAFTQTDIAPRCVILDEPTSALGHEATEQLLSHIRRASSQGVAVILITHRLNEILAVCDRAVVMLDGRVVAERPREGLTRSALVELSGHIEADAPRPARLASSAADAGSAMQVDDAGRGAGDLAIRAGAGAIIGFAGLDGHGQRERLRRIFKATQGRGIPAAFVAGDRGHEGVFALWSIADNLTIRSLDALQRAGFVRADASRSLAGTWFERLKVKAPSIDTPIVALSGGNQQKVLFARALASDAAVIFLDDPMRGVDVGTKQDVYRLIRAEADRGRCFVWYTTELEELSNCERVYVFREGRAAVELISDAVEPGRILEASFGGGHA